MYSDKKNINILTSVMKSRDITTVVVCPGSRNAPLAHNFKEAGFSCYAVTDERSAGFYALGLSLALNKPVAVCVTSGSAVLNLAPAVAEAAYRHVPILLISADRPTNRIGQLEGQTIVQPDVFGAHALCYTLPEPTDNTSDRFCNRLANEAILALENSIPVQINVPISNPLYSFNTPELPHERIIKRLIMCADANHEHILQIKRRIDASMRPMILVGQCHRSRHISDAIASLSESHVVLYESLSSDYGGIDFDRLLTSDLGKEYCPDFVLYIGDTFVSNRIKSFVEYADGCEVWALSCDGEVHDTFSRQTVVLQGYTEDVLLQLAEACRDTVPGGFKKLWDVALQSEPHDYNSYCEASVVKAFESIFENDTYSCFHYANSSAIRLGNRYSRHYNYVNRGVNGIEGSLSTAAGFSLATARRTYCVIGDLSFFYDCNALWNIHLQGNLRILLLNNGGGDIFRTLKGATASAAFDTYISASHHTEAKGICLSYDVGYRRVSASEELSSGLEWLTSAGDNRPLLLECVFSHK